ncbi:uncharacterized protein LOC132952708 [Metopolophium dirhodum]|uniref:uncharacterized protein LOC132952708 n=1 Tax=Metopolophium dirhodum TaxID=44670 RepID=UPI00298FA223|nr:uncharacterized protein LOC132952708 [Metopolophium dirhodum]
MSSPCEEYYRHRSSEIATQLAKWTQSAVVRDESFVRLLRAKVERRARLADAVAQVSRKAVAETRHALVANNNRAAAASDRAAAELGQFADGLRRADDDGGEATAAELDEMNARLREVIKLKREALVKAEAANKAAGELLRQEQAVSDRMAHNLTATADCDGPPTDRGESRDHVLDCFPCQTFE